MYSDLGHSQQQIRRRSLAHHPSPLHRRLHNSLPGSLLGPTTGIMVELHSQKLLHMVFHLHHNLDDKDLRADAREREGMEVRRVCYWRLPHLGAYRHAHILRLGRVATI
jgi:hypothetical protein